MSDILKAKYAPRVTYVFHTGGRVAVFEGPPSIDLRPAHDAWSESDAAFLAHLQTAGLKLIPIVAIERPSAQ